jgi:hypothetical protein
VPCVRRSESEAAENSGKGFFRRALAPAVLSEPARGPIRRLISRIGGEIRLIRASICADSARAPSDSGFFCRRVSSFLGAEAMAGKGGKGLLAAKTTAAKSAEKDKGKKAPVSRSSRAGLQVTCALPPFLPCACCAFRSVWLCASRVLGLVWIWTAAGARPRARA